MENQLICGPAEESSYKWEPVTFSSCFLSLLFLFCHQKEAFRPSLFLKLREDFPSYTGLTHFTLNYRLTVFNKYLSKCAIDWSWICLFTYLYLTFSFFLSFFFFGEEDWPWANNRCQSSSFCLRKIFAELKSVLIFLYFVCGMLPQYGLMSGV